MAVYKDGDKWRVIYRYTNWQGERKQTQKRGFKTKREAQQWERDVMLKSESKLDMTFASFFEIYAADKKKRVKENTWESKSHIIRTKILPYFDNRKIAEIEPKDVIAWQSKLLGYQGENGEVYSPTYLKTIHSQLTITGKLSLLPMNPSGNECLAAFGVAIVFIVMMISVSSVVFQKSWLVGWMERLKQK